MLVEVSTAGKSSNSSPLSVDRVMSLSRLLDNIDSEGYSRIIMTLVEVEIEGAPPSVASIVSE